MAGRVAFDTTFLIDLQRERSRGMPDGPAHRFLAADPDLELHLSATALGGFAEGFADADDPGSPRRACNTRSPLLRRMPQSSVGCPVWRLSHTDDVAPGPVPCQGPPYSPYFTHTVFTFVNSRIPRGDNSRP